MKKLLPCVIFALAVPMIYSQQPTPTPAPTKKVSDYTKELSDLQTWGKNLTNDKFYDTRFKFKEKKTDKELKFSDFSEFDRRMFQMTTTQRFNKHLDSLDDAWQEDLKKVKGKVPDSKGKSDAIAGADDVSKMIENLVVLRKIAVQSWESQANSMFKTFPKEFEEKDMNLYLKNIKILKDSLEGR